MEVYPNRLVAPLISYTTAHDVQSKSVISVLAERKLLPPCESEVIVLYHILPPQTHGHPLQTRPDFTRVAGEARAPGIPPPSRTMTLS